METTKTEQIFKISATETQLNLPVSSIPDSVSFETGFVRLEDLKCNDFKLTGEDVIYTEQALGFNENAIDCDLIKTLNEDPSLANDIRDFYNNDNSELSKTLGKKFAVEILKMIRYSSFRETEPGKEIYGEFLEFIQYVNVNQLEIHKRLLYDESILTNTALYIVLGIDSTALTGVNDLSKAIYNIINCSQYDTGADLLNTSEITDLGAASEENLRDIANEAKKSLDDAENAKKSYFGRTLNFFGSFLSDNAILRSTQKLIILSCFTYCFNYCIFPFALDKGLKLLSKESFGGQ